MRIFISYRRHDSLHAAHRVRMFLQQKFGEESVFIDREIPPGKKWEDHLQDMLENCDVMVVLVGDEFLQRIRQKRTPERDGPDPMTWEIASAIRMKKPIYPVLFGALDMPLPHQLPAEIQAFSGFQAVFAREPSFDVAMEVLAKTISTTLGTDFIDAPQGQTSTDAEARTENRLGGHRWSLMIFLLFLTWLCGRLSISIGNLVIPERDLDVMACWMGLKYLLLTTLLGLTPYVAYWLVAVLRARARLPIRNIAGVIGILNVSGTLIGAGMFLLLSSIPGWRLLPMFIFPKEPTLWHYFFLALGLLTIALSASTVIFLEPKVRRMEGQIREALLVGLNWLAGIVFIALAWLMASLLNSFPPDPTGTSKDQIAWLGYFCLVPTLSLIYAYGWKFGAQQLQGASNTWEWRYLFMIGLGVYFSCTLAMYSLGVGRVLGCLDCMAGTPPPI